MSLPSGSSYGSPSYFVLDPSGQKFGPANISDLSRWASEGRVVPDTLLEEVGTGRQLRLSWVLPIPAAPGGSFETPVPDRPRYAAYPTPQGFAVPNHMTKAVIATLVGCLPLGAAAIYFSSQVDRLARMGDIPGATAASRRSSTLSNLSFALAVLSIALTLIGGLGFLFS